MKALFAAVALLAAAPLAAQPTPEQEEVIAAADAFFAALRGDDKTALAPLMQADAIISINDKTGSGPSVLSRTTAAKFLENWAKAPPGIADYMKYVTVPVTDGKAQVAGPYRFLVNGKTTHCGINVPGFVKTKNGWKPGDTSFTMVPPSKFDALDAPEALAP
jgi:hypothetical protein